MELADIGRVLDAWICTPGVHRSWAVHALSRELEYLGRRIMTLSDGVGRITLYSIV